MNGAFYVDKAQAWVEYQEIFAGQDELLEIDPTILPASIRIELVAIELHQSVKFKLEQQQQVVRRVDTAAEQIEQLQNLSSVLNVLGIGMAIVLGVSAVVLIANTIRLAIYARRDEVEIMKLVGASNWYIRIPFLLEGLIEGVVGAALAVFTVWLGASRLAEASQGFALFRLDVGNQFFFRWGLALHHLRGGGRRRRLTPRIEPLPARGRRDRGRDPDRGGLVAGSARTERVKACGQQSEGPSQLHDCRDGRGGTRPSRVRGQIAA